jgi:hypothetical protein
MKIDPRSTMQHLTLDTGHSLTSPRSGVRDDVVRALKPIVAAGRGDLHGFHFRVEQIPGGWRFGISLGKVANGADVVLCHIAAPGGSEAAWQQLQRDRDALALPGALPERPAADPWLSVSFLPAMAEIVFECPDSLRAVGDAERCLAWTLLEHSLPGALNAPAVPPPSNPPSSQLGREFIRATRDELGAARASGHRSIAQAQASAAPRLAGTLASAIVAAAADPPGDAALAAVAQEMKRAVRLALHPSVGHRVRELNFDPSTLLSYVEKAVPLPGNPTWLEWSPRLDPSITAYGPDAQALAVDRIGVLITSAAAGLRLVPASYSDRAKVYPCVVEAGPGGIFVKVDPSEQGVLRGLIHGFAEPVAVEAIRVLAMLGARNSPLETGEAENYERLNRNRAKSGKPPLLSARPVRWDLDRTLRRMPRGPAAERREQAVASFVRGHPKVRKTGVYFWRPHVRRADLAADGELPEGRDYTVTASRGGLH